MAVANAPLLLLLLLVLTGRGLDATAMDEEKRLLVDETGGRPFACLMAVAKGDRLPP